MASERGSWMQTYTGAQFYPMDPRADEVAPADIAHALSLLCRYNGHVKRFYSVAEHCVLLSHAVPAKDALWALLHDATEAYVGDMIRHLKAHIPDYVVAEDRVMAAIAERFNLKSTHMPDSVHEADARILLDERAELMSEAPAAWTVESLVPLGVTITGWDPARAEREYLMRLNYLRDLEEQVSREKAEDRARVRAEASRVIDLDRYPGEPTGPDAA